MQLHYYVRGLRCDQEVSEGRISNLRIFSASAADYRRDSVLSSNFGGVSDDDSDEGGLEFDLTGVHLASSEGPLFHFILHSFQLLVHH